MELTPLRGRIGMMPGSEQASRDSIFIRESGNEVDILILKE
jgi:hypothetical protein